MFKNRIVCYQNAINFVKKNMLSYRLTYQQAQHHFISVEWKCPVKKRKKLSVQLPAWRPGRYELGNFAKNVRKFSIQNEKFKSIPFKKIKKDCWEVDTRQSEFIIVKYEYYAADLNAGSTYLDENLFYINPVNCCVYDPELINENLDITIQVPEKFMLACAMKSKSKSKKNGLQEQVWKAKDFHELADSPIIAGYLLQSKSYQVEKTKFTIWLQGDCKPDWNRMINDFSAFSAAQIKAFGQFPVSEYHFYIHALNFNFYHGVEHQNSSVNALGPAYELMGSRYIDLLGLCSHELYHAWNIKSIRPIELFPYDYTCENYFRTGYVAEGVTTYLGDYFLLSSAVFSLTDFLTEMNMQMQKHMDNFARLNYSLADSSFDTWLDGYVPGIPERKVSIYTEGCLTAFMTDILLLENSGNKYSLHTVMKYLYDEFYQKGKGYSEEDYWNIVEKLAGISFLQFRKKYIDGSESYLKLLEECMHYLGFSLNQLDCLTDAENKYGIKILETPQASVISSIHPDSPNYKTGLSLNDRLLFINDKQVNMDAHKWISYFKGAKIKLTVQRANEQKEITISPSTKPTFRQWRWMKSEKITDQQQKNYKRWLAAK